MWRVNRVTQCRPERFPPIRSEGHHKPIKITSEAKSISLQLRKRRFQMSPVWGPKLFHPAWNGPLKSQKKPEKLPFPGIGARVSCAFRSAMDPRQYPDQWGRFGQFGGKYAPEILMP